VLEVVSCGHGLHHDITLLVSKAFFNRNTPQINDLRRRRDRLGMKPRTGRLQQHPLAIQRMVVIVQMAVDVFLERKCPVYLPPHEGAVRDMELVAHEQVLLVAQRDRFGHGLPAFHVCEVLSPVPAAESRGDLAVVAFGCLPCEVDGVEGAAAAKDFGGRVTAVDVWELGVGSRGGWLLGGGVWRVTAVAVAMCDGGRKRDHHGKY
jgi:hypothetical protein